MEIISPIFLPSLLSASSSATTVQATSGYFDTGINANTLSKVEIAFKLNALLSDQKIFGENSVAICFYQNKWRVMNGSAFTLSTKAHDTLRHYVIITTSGYNVDGEYLKDSSGNIIKPGFSAARPIYINAMNNSSAGVTSAVNRGTCSIYCVRLYDKNNNLIRHYIPTISSTGIVSYYDLCTGSILSPTGTVTSGGGKLNYTKCDFVGLLDKNNKPLYRNFFIYSEYIYSLATGGKINLNCPALVNTVIQTKLMPLGVYGGGLIGGYPANSDVVDFRLFNASSKIYLDLPDKSSSGSGSRLIGEANTFKANTLYEFEFGNSYVKNVGASTNIVEGTAVTSTNWAPSATHIDVNCGGASNSRWYYIKVYTGTSLIHNFVPVLLTCKLRDNYCSNTSEPHSKGDCGLWDLVTDKFYGNSGTSTFIASPETYLEFLDEGVTMNGTVGFNTLYTPSLPNFTIELDYSMGQAVAGSTQCVFCARADLSSTTYTIFNFSNRTQFRSDYNSTQYTFSTQYADGTRRTLLRSNDKFYMDGNLIQTDPSATFTAGGPVTLFYSYTGNPTKNIGNKARGVIYSCRMWSDTTQTTLVRDMRAVKVRISIPDTYCANTSLAHSEGCYGLFDCVQKKFYGLTAI